MCEAKAPSTGFESLVELVKSRGATSKGGYILHSQSTERVGLCRRNEATIAFPSRLSVTMLLENIITWRHVMSIR